MPPPVTTGLQAHLDASALTGLSDGDKVASWTDESGNGNHFTQGNDSIRPIYKTGIIQGLPVVRFSFASLTELAIPNGLLSGASAGEIFMVLDLAADPPATGVGGIWRWGSSTDHYPYVDGVIYVGFGSSTRYTCGNPTTDLASPHVMNIAAQSGAWALRLNNSVFFNSGTNTVSFLTSGKQMGRSAGGGNYMNGDIAEILVYDTVLSSGDRDLVYDYLDAKWINPPADIPEASGTVTAQGSLSAVGHVTPKASGQVAAVGQLSATGHITSEASGIVSGEGSLTAVGHTTTEASGTVSAEASLTATGHISPEAAGNITAVGSLTATGAADEIIPTASGNISAEGSLTAGGHVDAEAFGTTSATGSLAATGHLTPKAADQIDAVGSLSAVGYRVSEAAGQVVAVGSLNATGRALDPNARWWTPNPVAYTPDRVAYTPKR